MMAKWRVEGKRKHLPGGDDDNVGELASGKWQEQLRRVVNVIIIVIITVVKCE